MGAGNHQIGGRQQIIEPGAQMIVEILVGAADQNEPRDSISITGKVSRDNAWRNGTDSLITGKILSTEMRETEPRHTRKLATAPRALRH